MYCYLTNFIRIITKLTNPEINELDIYIYAAYFKLNIFVFNFENNKIKLYYPEDELNIYKINIFLSYKNGIYYPLIYAKDNGRYYKYNSSILYWIQNSIIQQFTNQIMNRLQH